MAETYAQRAIVSKNSRTSRNISREAQWRLLTLSLLAADVLMLGAAFWLAFQFRFNLALEFFRLEVEPSIDYYRLLVGVLTPVWLLVLSGLGGYNRQKLLGGTHEYSLIFRATTIGLLMVVVADFLSEDLVIARGWVLLAGIFGFLCLAVGRFAVRRAVYYLRRHGWFLSPAIIVGANQEGRSLAEQLTRWSTSGLAVVGFVDSKAAAGTAVFQGISSLGSVDELPALIEQHDVEEVILASSAFSARDNLLSIFQQYGVSKNVNVRLSSGLYEIITTGLSVREFGYVPLVGVNKVRLTGLDRLLKLTLDYGLTLPGLIAISPLLLVIALLVKLESPGPAIYRRRVMGVNGKEFDAFKFRTMRVDGDAILAARPDLRAELALNHKLKEDPRITRIGRFLRKFSLDELPQLFNVLRAEMSLVGPRMISPDEMENYSRWGMNLLTVRPGLTGLWQVSGRSDVSYEERVRLDMFYIRNWTIWLDLQLLFQTIPAVVFGRGAY